MKNLEIKESIPAILLNHVPINPKDNRIDLTVSGHTHNGQIIPFNLIVRLTTKHVKGLYELDNGYIYVSPGSNTWGPQMRLGSKNEIVYLKLGKI